MSPCSACVSMISASSPSTALSRSSGCRLSPLRMAISARATGLVNNRSGRMKVASALTPAWPGASRPTRRAITGSPAQGLAVRSC